MPLVRARVSSKGQVTLPLELRRHLQVSTGDEIAFEFGREQRAEVRPIRRRPASDFSGTFAVGSGPVELGEVRRRAWRGRGKELERKLARR